MINIRSISRFRFSLPLCWCAILGAALLAFAPGLRAQTAWLDGIAAVVDDEVITTGELNAELAGIERQLRERKTALPPQDVLRGQVLERMILARVQLALAERHGLRVDDTLLDKTVDNIAAQNKMTLTAFRAALERDGYPYARFREDMRKDILLNQLRQREVDSRITVTEAELENQLKAQSAQGGADDEYRLGHILIAVPEAASPARIAEARQKAEQVLAQLRGGADFAQLAVANSADRHALEGGDLGWRKAGQLPTLFADLVSHMKPGELSDPIRSPSGFHILKLQEKRSQGDERHIVTQTLARHILIRTDELVSAGDARLRLERLAERIAQGEDFAALARSQSADRASAAQGGSLGWVSPGDMVPEFEQAMAALKDGQTSAPFETRYGWHLVQVLERRAHDDTDEQRRGKAREALRQRKIEEETQLWLRRLRDEAYVEYRNGEKSEE